LRRDITLSGLAVLLFRTVFGVHAVKETNGDHDQIGPMTINDSLSWLQDNAPGYCHRSPSLAQQQSF
jgi:hypothetical protein